MLTAVASSLGSSSGVPARIEVPLENKENDGNTRDTAPVSKRRGAERMKSKGDTYNNSVGFGNPFQKRSGSAMTGMERIQLMYRHPKDKLPVRRNRDKCRNDIEQRFAKLQRLDNESSLVKEFKEKYGTGSSSLVVEKLKAMRPSLSGANKKVSFGTLQPKEGSLERKGILKNCLQQPLVQTNACSEVRPNTASQCSNSSPFALSSKLVRPTMQSRFVGRDLQEERKNCKWSSGLVPDPKVTAAMSLSDLIQVVCGNVPPPKGFFLPQSFQAPNFGINEIEFDKRTEKNSPFVKNSLPSRPGTGERCSNEHRRNGYQSDSDNDFQISLTGAFSVVDVIDESNIDDDIASSVISSVYF